MLIAVIGGVAGAVLSHGGGFILAAWGARGSSRPERGEDYLQRFESGRCGWQPTCEDRH